MYQKKPALTKKRGPNLKPNSKSVAVNFLDSINFDHAEEINIIQSSLKVTPHVVVNSDAYASITNNFHFKMSLPLSMLI